MTCTVTASIVSCKREVGRNTKDAIRSDEDPSTITESAKASSEYSSLSLITSFGMEWKCL